ncbi:hypothetical protein PG991_012331 [Apiospora marii]|uniref:Uncharacterized protein n=1 Tax=Apiospora marii TaxID=335849 RepID=A0ABR1R9E9_9PEZI
MDSLYEPTIIQGLVPTTFKFFQSGTEDPDTTLPLLQHDDYVRLAFGPSSQWQRGGGLVAADVERVMAASARALLRDLGGLGAWHDLRRRGGRGRDEARCRLLDVYIVREQEDPQRVYIDRQGQRLSAETGLSEADTLAQQFETFRNLFINM